MLVRRSIAVPPLMLLQPTMLSQLLRNQIRPWLITRLITIGWLGIGCTILGMSGCDNHPTSTVTTNHHRTPQPAFPNLPHQSLESVASIPVVDRIDAATMTVTTSVSSTVAVPVAIQAGQEPNTYSIATVGEIGHSAAGIAAASTMLESISKAIKIANPDVAFIRSMLAHHEGAVALAQAQLRYGKDDTLHKLAQDIIVMRHNEIQWMNSWLDSQSQQTPQRAAASQPTPTALQQEPQYTDGLKEMYQQMLAGLNHADADIAFASSMIPHHKGALAMAQIEFKYGNDDKARAFADDIIASQQSEITLLKDWLKTHP